MKLILSAATALPLVLASAAYAETKISTASTTPVATSTAANGARDDVTIEKVGSIKLGQAGVAVTFDSSNKVRNDGSILFEDKNDSTGVLLANGVQGSLDNTGSIRLTETYTPTDSDKDGDLDGPFATGSNRVGVRQAAGSIFTGNVTNSGTIEIEGNDSAAIRLQGRAQGNVMHSGGITTLGDRSIGLEAADVTGNVVITGSVATTGANATAVSLGRVGGTLQVQGTLTATGYRSTDRLSEAVRGKFDADDLLQGGSSLRVSGSVAGGILLDRPPADTKADDKDEDKDGIPDADEKTANVLAFGSAPAIDLGGTSATVIGRVGAGDNAYGLVIKGAVRGAGVNDGVSATGIRIGQANGGTTTIDGGINIFSGATVSATAYGAAATGIVLNSGARADELINGGELSASVASDGVHNASALLIEQGATMRTVRNSGTLSAVLAGEAGDARAITDKSGTLSLIENTGKIIARITPTDDANDKDDADTNPANEVVTGKAIAVDLRATPSGTTIRQTRASQTAALPAIEGDLLFGAGADRFELLSGTYQGTLSFGAGADSFAIDADAKAVAQLADADDQLSIDLRKGTLAVTNKGAVKLTSLNVGSGGKLAVSVDPTSGTATRFDVAGAATVATGAVIDLNLTSTSRGERSYEIIRAGTLSLGSATASLSGAPYLYRASLRQDAAGKTLFVDLRPKTANELQLNRSGTQAYAAVFDQLGADKKVEAAFLGVRDRASFLGLYNQMLPDHSGATLKSASAVSSAISSALSEPLAASADDERGLAVWGQEIIFDLDHDAEDAGGYDAHGVGFATGIERAKEGQALGVALSYVSTDYKDQWAASGEGATMQFLQVGPYWRTEVGGLKANVRGAIGHVWFDGTRKLVSEADALDLKAKAKWRGWLGDAHAAASYDLGQGWLVARPEVSIDYLYLKEKGYRESGGGKGFDLDVDSRSGDLLTGTAAMAIGARFGSGFRWGPEVKAGWRQRLAGSAGSTTARFLSGGKDFTLSPEDVPDGETMVHLAFRGENDGISFSLEGGKTFNEGYDQVDVRAVGRFAF